MVEVFKTDVTKKKAARTLVESLSTQFPGLKINIDLADCDKVLRVEGVSMEASQIMILVKTYGFKCEVMD